MHVATNAVPKVDGRVIHRGTKEGDSPEITAEAERDLGYPNSIIEPGNSLSSISPSTASCARAIWLASCPRCGAGRPCCPTARLSCRRRLSGRCNSRSPNPGPRALSHFRLRRGCLPSPIREWRGSAVPIRAASSERDAQRQTKLDASLVGPEPP